MGMLNFTVTGGEGDRGFEFFQNLKTLLYGLMLPIALTMVSGFWYLFVPADINWQASQLILVLHLLGGVISLLIVIPFFILHQKEKKQRLRWLLTPWKLGKKSDENEHQFTQRQIGYLLVVLLLLTYGSGLMIALPGLLFAFDLVVLWENPTQLLLGAVHRWAGGLMVPVLLFHMLWLLRHKQAASGAVAAEAAK
ncbi:hypothetical protein [Motiliproteus sp.]|uniref:hypothetical protein n=1 Tax=Motiliproteus sp. TaxID=1898955 RepID=UPI003BAA02C7